MSEPEGTETNAPGGGIAVRLLDATAGAAVQSWQFENRQRLSIGRAAECDICLADPKVSRLHAELIFRDGWRLVSQGRNGTWIAGESVTETPVTSGLVCRLGMDGPPLQLTLGIDSISTNSTIEGFSAGALDFLMEGGGENLGDSLGGDDAPGEGLLDDGPG